VDGTILNTFKLFTDNMDTVNEKFSIQVNESVKLEMQDKILSMLGGKSSKFLVFKLISYVSKKLNLGPIKRIKFFLYLKKIYKENVGSVELIPGAIQTLKELKKRGHHAAFFTTTSSKEFNDRVQNKREILDFPEEIIVRDLVKRMKPDPAGTHLIKQRLNLDPSFPVVMIGDMTHDIEAGINAGGMSIGVLTGFNKEDELKNAGASLVLNSVKELVPMLPRIKELLSTH
jgi:HAD superfamily hydrolase (TIGR01549 family)